MNRAIAGRVVLIAWLILPHGSAHARATGTEKHDISVEVQTPPARILVVDSQGRRAGADPAVVLSKEGMPPLVIVDKVGSYLGILEEIPNTTVEPMNIQSEEPPYDLQPSTGWNVLMVDGGPQTYTMSLTGVQDGICKVRIRPDSGVDGKLLPITWVSVLVAPGAVRLLRVGFDPPRSFVPVVERVVAASDLGEDVAIACRLGHISPEGVCRSLKAKAAAIASSLHRGNRKAARGAVNAFLKELKAQSGRHIKDPAATILRDDASALLKTLNK